MDRYIGGKRIDLYMLLSKLRNNGGCIVLASKCSPHTLIIASNDMNVFYDNDGIGYVYLPITKR